jgi:hypothetical protein
MLDTGTIIATVIALSSALLALGLAVTQNAQLIKENKRLRMRVRELNKQVELHA